MGDLVRVGPPLAEAWYEARRCTVTASNSCHLMLGPSDLRWWLDPDALAARILGDEPVPRNERMEAGSFFETANLGWFGYVVGRAPEPDGYLTLDPSRPHVGASLDGRLGPKTDAPTLPFDPSLVVRDAWGRSYYGRDAVRVIDDLPATTLVEMKHGPSKSRPQYKGDEPPPYYACQVRHQMMVVGEEVGLLVARIDAYELWVHVIERDPGYETLLDEACREFYETKLRPALDARS